ncbi:MAG: D-alanyl-D-alanine carboxypeptidase [Alphaproteobacteria bacterium]|nr:D-alanyl-D-alanine carboxypeptidase [Alphaproteobacteria bacterium]MBN2674860.1 D-alanyl-D-alanine carboxypeptidase [Alphaproteobacteria bacterium]
MKKFIYLLSIISLFSNTNSAFAFSTNAKSVYMIDYDSGAELYSKNADVLMQPSSMIKLMTLTVLFDSLKSGDLKMDDMLNVGENADYKNPVWDTASKICLKHGQKISVRDTIMGLIVLSGGDAAMVVAEKLAGSESAFTGMMQKKARKIGMPLSTFANASGLPDPNNLMTTRELATLGMYIISNYPNIYPLFSTKRFEFNNYKDEWCKEWGRTHTLNYNKLLFIMSGADGLKTGHTKEGGYGMVASAKIGGRRLVAVINGLQAKNHDALAAEMKKILNYGFSSTMNKIFYNTGDKIAKIPVWYGRQEFVNATIEKPFAVTLKKSQNLGGLRVLARYNDPVPAPVEKGAKIGEIIAELNGEIIARAPLVSAERVGKTQFLGRIIKNLGIIFGGK